jgi:L-lactate permease
VPPLGFGQLPGAGTKLFLRAKLVHWTQVYDPFGRWWLSTLVATLPLFVLFGLLVGLKVKPHWCAIAGALTAAMVAVVFFKMPLILAATSFGYGVAFGLLKIAWIVLAAVFLYDISVETGQFEIMKESVAGITADRRLQVLLVAFCFGAFIEGAAGFGAPSDDRAGLPAISRGGAESDRQHRARGLGQHRDSHPHPGGHVRFAGIGFECDHRAHPAFHRGDRAVLAGTDHGRLARDF